MAFQDRLTVLCEGADPGALTANTAKLLGNAVDFRIDQAIRQHSGLITHTSYQDYTGDNVYLNLHTTAAAQNASNTHYIFALNTDDGLSGTDLDNARQSLTVRFKGSDLKANWTSYVVLPPNMFIDRYFQLSIEATAAQSDESLRITAWIGIDPHSWRAIRDGRK